MRTGERGFTLLELLVCVGMVAIAGAATVGAFAAVARNATPGTVRDLALMVAENAVTRARAAVAYAPSPTPGGAPGADDRSWALPPGAARYVAGAQLRANACGGSGTTTLQFPVVTTFDTAAQRFTVVVTYPRDPCRVAADGGIPADDAASVTIGATLPPSAYPPGRQISHDVLPPARM